jgi:asparagine synthetase B (glutamine-hydrolysing)
VVGTKDGFGVVRDPIACKPAVMAETEQYVAFGSEYRALVNLPGIDTARCGSPSPPPSISGATDMAIYDIEADGLRGLNDALHQLAGTTPNEPWEVVNPKGSHAIAVGLDAPLDVTVKGLHRLLLRRHEQAGDDPCGGLGRAGRGREHDVRHRHRGGRREPVCRGHGPWRASGYQGQCQSPAAVSR